MKKVLCCFLLSVTTSIVRLMAGYGITRHNMRQEQAVPNTVVEAETVNDVDNKAVMNQEEMKPTLESTPLVEEYYLVSESGLLLMFCSDRNTICLYTHILVADSSEMERVELTEGVWPPSVIDVCHYLELYTSWGTLEYIF